ncbi:MAG: ATP-binding cassette domain-containing protein, partial [Rhodobacteraceae bacterium]|nr:ATP-binding cassette domain-containing protein [Paracoccaceae bacterium]
MNELITAQNLSVRHGATEVLSGVNFTIARCEIVTVIGPNGSGKSTLIRALIGLEPAATGQVARAPGLAIGYVPQKLH